MLNIITCLKTVPRCQLTGYCGRLGDHPAVVRSTYVCSVGLGFQDDEQSMNFSGFRNVVSVSFAVPRFSDAFK